MDIKKITILLVALFMVMIGYGLTQPILPFLVEKAVHSNSMFNLSPALHVGLITGVFPLTQFIVAPMWGYLSDRTGRSPVLAIGMGGYAISLFFFGWTDNLALLYLFRLSGGFFSASVFPTVNSWIADLSPVSDRGKVMAWTGGAASLGIIFGPALSSFFIDSNWFGSWSWKIFGANAYTVPFTMAGSLSTLALAAILLWMPTGTSADINNAKRSDNPGFLSSLKGELLPILFYALIAQGALSTFESTFALHAQQTLGYSVHQMGFIFMACGLGMSTSQAGLTGYLIDQWGEERLLPVGFMLTGISLFLLMFVNAFILILIVVIFFATGMALVSPSLASLTSKISNRNVGQRMGMLTSFSSLGLAAGSFLGAGLYSINIHLPYFAFSVLVLAVPVYIIKRFMKQEKSL